MVEGRREDLPPLPAWDPNWQLGTPDLVVTPEPFVLGADGSDLYHNFVVPIPVTERRFVRGVELRSGNSRVVHHAFVQIDGTDRSRRRAAGQKPPGFDGMEAPETAVMPGGQLLGFQPGKMPSFAPPGLSWELKPGSDLVLQAHLNRTGKPESVQPSVAFFFTDEPPTNRCFRLKLSSLNLDIPPGKPDYRTLQSYVLPVDVKVLRVSAHAHFLGKRLEGYAKTPDGRRRELLTIPDWDFKWQGDYGFSEPIFLPKGSVLTLDFQYDNSTNNVRNPHNPPQRVRWGLQSVDEMGEFTLQVLPVNPGEWVTLAQNYSAYFMGVSREFYAFRVGNNPDDAEARRKLGRILASQGNHAEALVHLREAIRLDPKADEPHFDLGNIYLREEKWTEAYEEFRTVARLNPEDAAAFGSLGVIALRSGKTAVAKAFLQRALQLNPNDEVARRYLERLSSAPVP
jgi:hypothetical protein